MSNKKSNIFLFLILLAGLIVRLLSLNSSGMAFTYDQGRDLLDLRNMVLNHKLSLIGPETSLRGVYYGPLWYWLSAPTLIISNFSPYSTEILLFFIVAISAILLYRLSKNKTQGLILSTTILFLPVFFDNSLIPLNTNPALFILPVIFLLLTSKITNTSWIITSLLSASLFHFDTFAALALVPIMIYTILRSPLRRMYLTILWITSTSLLYVPQLIFNLKHQYPEWTTIINLLHGQSSLRPGTTYIVTFITDIGKGFGLNHWLPVVIISTFITIIIIKYHFPLTPFVKLNFIYSLLLSSILIFSPFRLGPWHLGAIIGSLSLGFVILLYSLKSLIAWVLLIVIFTTSFIYDIRPLLHNVPQTDTANIKTRLTIIDTIYQNAEGKGINIYTFAPNVYDFPNQYLIWWRAKTRYKYLPKEYVYLSQQPLYVADKNMADSLIEIRPAQCSYLIIEPYESQKKWYDQWRGNFPIFSKQWQFGETRIEKLCP